MVTDRAYDLVKTERDALINAWPCEYDCKSNFCSDCEHEVGDTHERCCGFSHGLGEFIVASSECGECTCEPSRRARKIMDEAVYPMVDEG